MFEEARGAGPPPTMAILDLPAWDLQGQTPFLTGNPDLFVIFYHKGKNNSRYQTIACNPLSDPTFYRFVSTENSLGLLEKMASLHSSVHISSLLIFFTFGKPFQFSHQ